MKTKEELMTALEAAKAAPSNPCRASGCGRAYVHVHGLDKSELRMFAAAAKKLDMMFLRKAYGTAGNVLYVGYDNADGRALARAEAMASALNAHGVKAYTDPVED